MRVGKQIFETLGRLIRARDGAVALTFAIIYGGIIVAFDIAWNEAQVSTDRIIMQGNDDNNATVQANFPTAGLSAATIAADRALIAATLFAQNDGVAACPGGTPNVDTSVAGQITVSADCTWTTGVASLQSVETLSTIQLSGSHVEIAMVLDNTGSMASTADGNSASSTDPTKITGLKQAALSFLQILEGSASGPGVVRIGMTPFTTDVNIVNPGDPNESGTQIGNTAAQQAPIVDFAPYILEDLIDTGTVATPLCNDPNNYVMRQTGGVTGEGLTYYSQVNTGTYSCPHTKKKNGVTTTTYQNTGENWYTMPSALFSYSNWSGCVVDRDEQDNPTQNNAAVDYSVLNTIPDSTLPGSLFPADNIDCGDYTVGPLSMIPMQDIYYPANLQLLYDRLLCRPDNDSTCATASSPSLTTLSAGTSGGVTYTASYDSGPGSVTLNGTATNETGMLANGDTDLTIGLAWGWNMLTPLFPAYPTANQSSGAANGIDKFLVFFTDGQNTQNRFSFTQSVIDTETTTICNNIKAAGITIFTIGTADADSTILNSCATTGDNYTGLQSNAIQGAFEDIANQISSIRFSQ